MSTNSAIGPRARLLYLEPVRRWLFRRRWGSLGRWWRRRQRRIDREFLWPAIYARCFHELPLGMDKAKAGRAFALRAAAAQVLHIQLDPAWRFPDEWASEPEATVFSEMLKRMEFPNQDGAERAE